jgi:ArsR family transcriptional regulator
MIETELFKQLSDETRLRCLMLMLTEGELCVCELTHALKLSQPKISRHLAHLRQSGVVQDQREGQWIHYRLHDDLPQWAYDVLSAASASTQKAQPYIHDMQMLKDMPNRPGSSCCA